jgi:hypothetical protein
MSDRSAEGKNGETGISEERIAELEIRIEELSADLREPPRGPLGLPRPPTPGELLAFVDDHAIPTTIAVLEANVRALKALRGAIGLLRRAEERTPGDRTAPVGDRADGLRARTDSVAREAVTELDRAVSDLATAIEGEALPDNEEARSVLREIRTVRDEVAGALATDDPGTTDGTGGGDADDPDPGDGGSEGASNGGATEIDVESELESIKDEMRPDESPGNGTDRGGTDGS